MKFRKKVTFFIIVLKILLVTLVCSFPKSFSRKSQIRGIKLPRVLSINSFPTTVQSYPYFINGEVRSEIKPVCQKFNLPDTKYSLISTPKPFLNSEGIDNMTPGQCKSHKKSFSNYNYLKSLAKSSKKVEKEYIIPPEFSSEPNYRDIGHFPEVEYPMTAREMWKPNYWNPQSNDHTYKSIDLDQFCPNPNLNNNFKQSLKNLGKLKQSAFATKSYNDLTENVMGSKNKGSKKEFEQNITSTVEITPLNDNDHKKVSSDKSYKNFTISSESPNIGQDMEYPIKNISANDFSKDICYNDTNLLQKSTNFLKTSEITNLISQSPLLVNAYAEEFHKEMKSILRELANDILLNNFGYTKEKAAPCTQLTEQTDILERNCNNLNIYNEFTYPDLVKNRRSQDFDEFTRSNKISNIDFESKLASTDLLISSYADQFNKDMTSVIKSKADNFLPSNHKNPTERRISKNENDMKRSSNLNNFRTNNEHRSIKLKDNKYTKKEKDIFEPGVSFIEDKINSYVDEFNNEMTSVLKSMADNILVNSFDDFENKPYIHTPTHNSNYKFNNKSNLPQKGDMTPNSDKEPLKDDWEVKLKATEDLVNSYADKFDKEMTSMLKSVADNILQNKFDIPIIVLEDKNYNSMFSKSSLESDSNYVKNIDRNIDANGYKFNSDSGFQIPEIDFKESFIAPEGAEEKNIFADISINSYVEKFNNEMTSILKSVADNIMLDFEPPMNQNLKYKDNPMQSDLSYGKKDYEDNAQQTFCKKSDDILKLKNKTSTPFNDLPSNNICKNDMTYKNEAPLINDKHDDNIITNIDNKNEIFIHEEQENNVLQSSLIDGYKDIAIDEDYTTDSYPEDEDHNYWSSYALSTVAPRTSSIDPMWRDSKVIEPDNCISYPDELDQYFLLS